MSKPVYEGVCMIEGCCPDRHERIHHFWAHYNAKGERWCGRSQHWVEQDQFQKSTQWCKACRSGYIRATYDPEKVRARNARYYYRPASSKTRCNTRKNH